MSFPARNNRIYVELINRISAIFIIVLEMVYVAYIGLTYTCIYICFGTDTWGTYFEHTLFTLENLWTSTWHTKRPQLISELFDAGIVRMGITRMCLYRCIWRS